MSDPSSPGDPASRPSPQRKALPSDPTMPIRLERAAPPPPPADAPTPPALPVPPPAPPPAEWIGTERTVVGIQPAADPPPAQPAQVGEWTGTEQTVVGAPAPRPAPAEEWTGTEQTVVGAPAPRLASPLAMPGEDDWVGREATLLGVAAGQGGEKKKEGTSTAGANRTPSRATQPTMDDGWHFKGRQGPLTGKTLGDYEVGGILGEGGMGTVYRGRQLSLKRRVAIKVLPPNLAQDAGLRTRFEQEARTASLLQSPHVVAVYAAGAQEDVLYFVMEFVEGTDLSAIIHEKQERSERFTAEEAAGYIIQAARGLAEAARHNIVHRDIKPANLMVTAKGVVKIADFGISKVAGEHGLTMTGTTVGTPAYCSPEQGRGDPVDPRADLYSLGVVFYELLTGRKPFDGATANALIYQHNYVEPELPTKVDPQVSEAYQAVCLKCLMKDPAKRYADAGELVADMERVRDGNMSLTAVFQAKFGTGADDAMIRMGLKSRYGRWWVVAAALLVLAGGGGGLWGWMRYDQGQKARAEANQQRDDYRKRLAHLDQAVAVKPEAADDLRWWKEHYGNDGDSQRWSAKLDRVVKAGKELGALLDLPELPERLQRDQAERLLVEHRKDVGEQGDDVKRWSARLAEAETRGEVLRGELRTSLTGELTLARRKALAPKLAEFTRLVGSADSDQQAWAARCKELDDEVAALAGSLKALDAELVPEAAQVRLGPLLKRYTALVGEDADDARRWGVLLARAASRLDELRRGLDAIRGQLGSGGLVGQNQANAVQPLLDEYARIADAGDQRLKEWRTVLEASARRLAELRGSLAKTLDRKGDLNLVELSLAKEALREFGSLCAAGDQQLLAWNQRVQGEEAAIAAQRRQVEALVALPAAEHPTLAVRLAAADALRRLTERGAAAPEQQAAAAERIAKEEAYEKELRTRLAARKGDRRAATEKQTRDDLERLELIAGPADPEVAAWKEQLRGFFDLLRVLEVLDRREPVPASAAEKLVEFEKIVGEGDESVKKWRAKLQRVAELRSALAPVAQVRPLPAEALANARELVETWVGEGDVEAKAWLAKARRVTELRTDLERTFAPGVLTDWVLPADHPAPREAEELVALTGESEIEVRRWAWRARVLSGPPRPAWATGFDRDSFGFRADLALGSLNLRFRYVPAGTVDLGSPPDEAGRDGDEPRVPGVTISRSFWLLDSEVTQDLYRLVTGANPARFQAGSDAGERPVERVSWNDARAFLDRFADLVERERGAKVRAQLPSEAEWELACRAGLDAPYCASAAVAPPQLASIAWFDLPDGTRGVRRREPNRLGLFDLHGNVWEWCRDKYGTYSPAETVDPEGRQEETRVVRGGCWSDAPAKLRAANRLALKPDLRTLYVGFRFRVEVDWPPGKEPIRPGGIVEQPISSGEGSAPFSSGEGSALPDPPLLGQVCPRTR